MGRTVLTILGIAGLAIVAVIFAQKMTQPAQEKVEAGRKVLTNAYEPQLEDCYVPQDAELPADVRRPGVDEDLVYVVVVVLYPGVDQVPTPAEHRLADVNGGDAVLEPLRTRTEVAEDGTYLTLLFRTDHTFEFGSLVREKDVLFERISLD